MLLNSISIINNSTLSSERLFTKSLTFIGTSGLIIILDGESYEHCIDANQPVTVLCRMFPVGGATVGKGYRD